MTVQERTGSKKVRQLIGLAIVGLTIAAGLWMGFKAASSEKSSLTTIAQQAKQRDFSLRDADGQSVSLATYKGKWLLMFFGFTSCPEACPMAMQLVTATLEEMGQAGKNVSPAFVSIDPERDTPAVLKEYLAHFSENIAGLSGTAAETAAIAKAYGVYYSKRPIEGDYTMDHSTAFYLVAPDGTYVQPFRADVAPSELASNLMRVMNTTK